MDYIIVSTAVIDRITDPRGNYLGEKLGGAGIYAYTGAKIWSDDAILVTGIGRDFNTKFEYWIRKNNVDVSGLIIKDEKTAISNINYLSADNREETPEFGREHYQKMEATTKEIASKINNTKGVYIFKDCNKDYWNEVFELKKNHNFKVMWELNGDVCKPDCLELVKEIAKNCEMISLNKSEAFSLLGSDDLNYVKRELIKWNIPLIYLRVGDKGAIMISPDIQINIPTVKNINVIDTTGAGNSSTAAIMVGYCENMDIYEIGLMGSIAAAFTIKQFGPTDIDENIKFEAKKILVKMKQNKKD
ncbi:MAG: hypothetical protein GYA87_10165 [Christensenellaceae bacterium]|nr:hypothetical protein [Christensenellaceae bacterium]